MYFNQEQRARSRRLTTPAGWPPCSSRQATTLLSFDIRRDLFEVNRANRRRSSSRSPWSGRPVISAGGDRGFDARGSYDPALGVLGSCTQPAATFCVGTAVAWSTEANARTWPAEQPSEPTERERGWATMARSSTRSRRSRPACVERPIVACASKLTRRQNCPSPGGRESSQCHRR